MMRRKILGTLSVALFLAAASFQVSAAARRESAPPFQVSSLQPLHGEGTWSVPGHDSLKVKVQRRSGNGPKGWLIEVVGKEEASQGFFYLMDGATKYNRSALYFAEVDGRQTLVSWQPDLDVIDVFPSPQRIPRQVTFWMLGDCGIKRSGPFPRSILAL